MKQKLPLNLVLNLKNAVEKMIDSIHEDIVNNNATTKNFDTLLIRKEEFETQLVILKEAIQLANQSKMFGYTNNFRIYTLSNLASSKRFYSRLLLSAKKAKGSLQLTVPFIKSKLSTLNLEIAEIEAKLTEFNTKKKVWVDLNPALDLSPKSTNNRSIRKLFGF